MLTECGGIAVKKDEKQPVSQNPDGDGSQDWGYTCASETDFLDEYGRIINAIYESDLLGGFCYTQLADVEQETNGLLTCGHQYKFDPVEIRKINERKK